MFFTYSILILNRKEKNFLVSTVVAALLNIILNIILLPKYMGICGCIYYLIAEFVVMCITAYYSVKVVCFDFNIKIFFQTLIGCLGIGACMCILLDKTCMSDNIKLIIEIFISSFDICSNLNYIEM
ncbi:MAG: polysaccharide biosynthesis C-terminal domain-containing protein [Blautia massiliensis (ex Durand et al. 2017)]|uniref:polysaccharide biosynthesis C-terminal domain-containing protein n=1 Tax=Blautia massiliensis (ex Durand et al. 2017) TaxID=1737424 RepID=UPI003996396F